MAKIRKSVFRSGIVMLSLLAAVVLSGGVAEAQLNCGARVGMPPVVRAEGMTEVIGDIQVRCLVAAPEDDDLFGDIDATIPAMLEISVQLNTSITNSSDDGDIDIRGDGDAARTYSSSAIDVTGNELTGTTTGTGIDDGNFGDGELSADGTMVTWEIETDVDNANPLNLDTDGQGFSLVLAGVRANASSVGDGEDIMVNVYVGEDAVTDTPIKAADVSDGLDADKTKVTAASGLQCTGTGETAQMALVRFVEGFGSAFTTDHSLVLHLRGIPDDVTVMASRTGVGAPLADPGDGTDLAPITLMEDEASTTAMVEVTVSDEGTATLVYNFDAGQHDPDGEGPLTTQVDTLDSSTEWNDIHLTFAWEAGAPLGVGTVTVSFNPVSTDDDDTPRFVSGAMMDVVELEECVTSLLFPFVTNMYGFETGIAITNTSAANGSCMIDYSGSNAPADDGMIVVMAESTATVGLSTIAPGFQGYADLTCNFRNGKGFAFISNGFGSMGGPTAAQGYLVADELQDSD